MKRRVTLNDYDLWETIKDTCTSTFQANDLRIQHFESAGLGMIGKFMVIDLPELNIVHSVANLPYELGINVTIGQPLLQMHFGLTGYEYSTIGGSNHLHVYPGQHNLFYLPTGQKDFLMHAANFNYITFEVNFQPSYLVHLLNGNFSMIAEFHRLMETGDAALLGKESKPITREMQEIIHAILHCNFPDPLRQLYLNNKVQELFILQLAQFANQTDTAMIKLHPTDKERLHNIREMMQSSLDLPYSLTELANKYGLNTDKLKKGYKQLFGTTVFGHLREFKMNNASKLLKEGHYSIAEIATITGYKNPQHFSKAYKNAFGMLPRDVK